MRRLLVEPPRPNYDSSDGSNPTQLVGRERGALDGPGVRALCEPGKQLTALSPPPSLLLPGGQPAI